MGDSRVVAGHPSTAANLWRSPRLAHWASWGVVLLAGALYLVTLDTGLRPDEMGGGDLITHQYAQVEARPGNAPGYPLYTMGGWLWFRLTGLLFGWALNPVQRLSSYSTLWALLALILLYHLVLRVTRGRWPLAVLSTLFYAVTYFFWYYSVTTEQYTSAVFQTLLIVWLALRWDERTADLGRTSEVSASADRCLLWLALVCGTCLANLVTVLFIVPPLVWFILSRQPGVLRRPALLGRMAALALLPLLTYAYVYWRGATHPEWRGAGQWPGALAWFVDFLTTHQGRDEMAPGLSLNRIFTGEFPALMWGELTVVVFVGGLIGLWWLGRRRAILVGGTLSIYFIICWVDRFGNWYQVIMPAYPLIVMGLAAGADALLDWRRSTQMGRRGVGALSAHVTSSAVGLLVLLGFLALTAFRFAASWPRADQSWRPEDTGLDPGWAIMADMPQENSVVVGDHDEWLGLTYLMTVWGARPAIYPQPLCRPEAGHTPLPVSATYLTRQAAAAEPGCMADLHRYAAGAELIRVEAKPQLTLPPSAHASNVEVGGGLVLAGYEVNQVPQPITGATGRPVSLAMRWRYSLYWQAKTRPATDYTVSVRPETGGQPIPGADGQLLIQDHQPVWGSYPTTRWQPGEVVRDDYVLSLPGEVVPDGAHIVVYRVTPDGQGGTKFETLGDLQLVLR